jgi:hypothetical protein
VWLLRWLLFRFMFLSGAVKLASGDPAWSAGLALQYYLETQPLPTPLAWYAHQLPVPLLQALVVVHFAVELAASFLIFLPRRPRLLAATGFLALQLAILATGNFGFFNLLTLVLLVPLLDDAWLARRLPARLVRALTRRERPAPGRIRITLLAAFALLALGVGSAQMARRIELNPDTAALPALAPWRLINAYGVFAFMPVERREIVLEASDDGARWRELAFRYKPGALDRAPAWIAPHQPRLDWQMWFAALGEARDSPWLVTLAARLLEGDATVGALLDASSLGPAPPRQLRARVYRYRYASAEEHARGQWWTRELEGEYLPPVTRETVSTVLRRGAGADSFIRWK